MSGWAARSPSSSYRRISPATARHWSDSSARPLEQAAGALGPETVTILDSSLKATGVPVGTALYMSPEQACGEEIDARSDLFLLGTVLYEMVTGVLPFQGKKSVPVMAAIMHRPHLPATEANPSVPRDLARIIDKALEKDPEMRYQTASDLRPDLSPDGNWLSFGYWGRQEDIFVVRADGAGLRQLTDDVHCDRRLRRRYRRPVTRTSRSTPGHGPRTAASWPASYSTKTGAPPASRCTRLKRRATPG